MNAITMILTTIIVLIVLVLAGKGLEKCIDTEDV
jgi:thiamine transporter ThiT